MKNLLLQYFLIVYKILPENKNNKKQDKKMITQINFFVLRKNKNIKKIITLQKCLNVGFSFAKNPVNQNITNHWRSLEAIFLNQIKSKNTLIGRALTNAISLKISKSVVSMIFKSFQTIQQIQTNKQINKIVAKVRLFKLLKANKQAKQINKLIAFFGNSGAYKQFQNSHISNKQTSVFRFIAHLKKCCKNNGIFKKIKKRVENRMIFSILSYHSHARELFVSARCSLAL